MEQPTLVWLKVGKQLLSHLTTPSNLDREGVHGPDRVLWSVLKHREAPSILLNPKIHWFQLELRVQICGSPEREIASHTATCERMATPRCILLSTQSSQSPWKASKYLLHIPSYQTFSLLNLVFLMELYLTLSQVACDIIRPTWPIVDLFPPASAPKQNSPDESRDSQFELVGICK